MTLYGPDMAEFPSGMNEAADIFKEVKEEIRKALLENLQKLAKLAGNSGEPLPASPCDFKSLPSSMQQEVLNRVKGNWQANGFDSELDAENFLRNSASFQPFSQLGLKFCSSPPNPALHRPGTYGVFTFGGFQGGIAP